MSELTDKFSRAIREVLRINSSRGFAVGSTYPKQDTADFVKRQFSMGDIPDLSIPNAGNALYECAAACVPKFQWEALPYGDLANWMDNNDGRGVLICGAPGTGKTFLATVFAALAYMYHGALFTIAIAQEINEHADELKRDKFVMIDDIGVEELRNDYGNRSYVVSELVDMAERRGTFLVLTSNLTPGQLAAKYGTRTYDRLNTLVRSISFAGTNSHRVGARRSTVPVPLLVAPKNEPKGKEALRRYWESVPEHERYAWEDYVMHTDRGDFYHRVPMHPVTHFAYMFGLTDRDVPLPGVRQS